MGRFDNMMKINAQRNNEKLTAKINQFEMENADLLSFIEELCNEFMEIDEESGKFQGCHLAERANIILGI